MEKQYECLHNIVEELELKGFKLRVDLNSLYINYLIANKKNRELVIYHSHETGVKLAYNKKNMIFNFLLSSNTIDITQKMIYEINTINEILEKNKPVHKIEILTDDDIYRLLNK